MKIVLITIFLSIYFGTIFAFNPYKILDVPKSASLPTIKNAYKRLVRIWHPDKNDDPNAESRFIEINQAYELLSDPVRRENFDRYGVTEPVLTTPQEHSETFFTYDNFGYGHFRFNIRSNFNRYSINARKYDNIVSADSKRQPYLLLFYRSHCFSCMEIEPLWDKLANELKPLGMGMATLNTDLEPTLTNKLGVSKLPYLIGIIDGHVFHFKDSFGAQKVYNFIRKLFPARLITKVDDSNINEFFEGWFDNRVRILIYSHFENIKIRYLIMAFNFMQRAKFGYVDTKNLRLDYQIEENKESLLVFDEYHSKPFANISRRELTVKDMYEFINRHKFLILTWVSSQDVFDELCPSASNVCLLFVIKSNDALYETKFNDLRYFVKKGKYYKNNMKFGYINMDVQHNFINALNPPQEPNHRILALYRMSYDTARYLWLNTSLDSDYKELLKKELHLIQTSYVASSFPNIAVLPELIDELKPSLMHRIIKKIGFFLDHLWYDLEFKDLLPAISILFTIVFVVFFAYGMSYLAQKEMQNIDPKYKANSGSKKPDCKLQIHELRGETYNGLIRLLKPGCRTLVLLIDAESKPKLLPKFFRHVYPYRRNKTLMFSFLMLEKNLDWYHKILKQALVDSRDFKINPKNCVGTVLSINGYRKYFCVYHAKQKLLKTIKSESSETESEAEYDVESGSHKTSSFKESEDDYTPYLLEEDLLDKFPIWLDRLFEGSTQRYYIQYWPESMK